MEKKRKRKESFKETKNVQIMQMETCVPETRKVQKKKEKEKWKEKTVREGAKEMEKE